MKFHLPARQVRHRDVAARVPDREFRAPRVRDDARDRRGVHAELADELAKKSDNSDTAHCSDQQPEEDDSDKASTKNAASP